MKSGHPLLIDWKKLPLVSSCNFIPFESRIGCMHWLSLPFRFLILVTFSLIYFLIGSVGALVIRDPVHRKRFFAKNVSRHVKVGLWCFNTTVTAINTPKANENFLFIGNHLGFLDIFVASSIRPLLFITSVEMKKTPLLGQFCEMGGCLFVERRSRNNIQNEIGEIRQGLKDGLDIALYPEGTSGHGAFVLPLKKSLLTSAAGTGVKLKPMILNYTKINGEPMSHKYREWVCWYGDQAFAPSVLRLLTAKSIEARIEFLDEVEVKSEEDRREIAGVLHSLMQKHFHSIPYPEGQAPPELKVSSPGRPATSS